MTSSPSPRVSSTEDDSLSGKVLEAVAAREGVDPIDLPEPLYEAIDPDALDELFRDADPDCSVEFDYLDYRVTAYADGTVDVDAVLG